MKRRLESFLQNCVVLSVIFSALASIPFRGWLQEALVNFYAYLLVGNIASIVALLLLRRTLRRKAWISGLVLSALFSVKPLLLYLPFVLPIENLGVRPADALCQRTVSVLYANVETSNTEHAALRSLIEQRDPDIVMLLEVDQVWDTALSLHARYPTSHLILRQDNFGLAIYSKLPWSQKAITDVEAGPPIIAGSVEVPGFGPLSLALFHAMPPASSYAFNTNRLFLRRLAGYLKDQAPDGIVAGDMNATPFSPFFQVFREGGDLRHALWGRGLWATWNAKLPFLRLMLDHIFYKGDVRLIDIERLDRIGSDHFPLFASFQLCRRASPGRVAYSGII